jgi:hypothetical protein
VPDDSISRVSERSERTRRVRREGHGKREKKKRDGKSKAGSSAREEGRGSEARSSVKVFGFGG